MGYGARAANVYNFLAALERLLAEQNYGGLTPGASIAAANHVYANA
jgi:hypothetical protein